MDQSVLEPWDDETTALRGAENLMDHQLRLVFRQVPQNICLYFFGTKYDIWAHLTYRDVHFFIIWAHPDRHWVIAGFHLVLCKEIIEKNDFWRSEYGYCITGKCFQLMTIRRWELRGLILLFLALYHSLFLLSTICYVPPIICRKKVILVSCHWRAALPSHKSIKLHATVLMNLKLNHKTASNWVNDDF